MAAVYEGVNFNNLRKALYLLYFGVDEGKCNDFSSPKYKYIIPMQGNFANPLQIDGDLSKDTFIMYWIVKDTSLTRDDYVIDENNEGWNRQKCVADILVRFIGKDAEQWVRVFRHLNKRKNVPYIWSGVCNAHKFEYTSPIIPTRINYSGRGSQIAFDLRFKLGYDEIISTGWKPLDHIDFVIKGDVKVAGDISVEN